MIAVRSPEEIALIREAGRLVALSHQLAAGLMREGVRTDRIDREVETFIRDRGGRPAFKGFQGYPASVCVSLNNEVVHGIPGKRVLREGDVVSLDIGVERAGYYADSAWTHLVGDDRQGAQELLDVCRESLMAGIARARPGNRLFDISHAVQTWVESRGYSVVREMVGHGIGTQMHEEPQIPNYGPPGKGPLLKAGMVFAIEPMVNQGTHEISTLKDGWTAVTRDGSLSAHFEHTIALTEDEPQLLTLP
jgi:methionyl aminopeptidase